MTVIPEIRRCKICGTLYSWNPDIGRIMCPYCAKKLLKKLLEKWL